MIETICKQCNIKFMQTKDSFNKGGKYCSRQCYYNSKKGKPSSNKKEVQYNICSYCKAQFEVGNSSGIKKTQVFCNRKCQYTSNIKHNDKREIPELLKARLGMDFEGDGAIMLIDRSNAKEGISLRLVITSVVPDRLLDYYEKTGLGNITKKDNSKTLNSKDCYVWTLNGESARALLIDIIPFIRHNKKERAEFALEVMEKLQDPTLRYKYEWQQEAKAKMKLLNKRGS